MANSRNIIPPMTNPLGRYWEQPKDICQVPMDETHAILTHYQLSRLKNYSTSMPSGVYPGKCWVSNFGDDWYLRWYGLHADPSKCSINQREILLVE